MSHELDTSNNRANMAFVGELPWHRLGQRLTPDAKIGEWITAAGFDWSANSSPVTYTTDAGELTMPEKQVLYRSDTRAALSVVGAGYKVVQPREVMEFFRDITESGDWELHTAGMLDGGRRMWAMARPKGGAQDDAIPGDAVRPNLLLATSLDGTLKTHAAFTVIRVVCANTVQMALEDVAKNKRARVAVSHRSEFNADSVKETLQVAPAAYQRFLSTARRLSETAVAPDQARQILCKLIAPQKIAQAPAAGGDFAAFMAKVTDPNAKPAKDHRNVSRILELYSGAGRGASHKGVAGTAWGLLNAVTEFVDHEAARTADARLNSAWFGKGNDLKSDALAALLALS